LCMQFWSVKCCSEMNRVNLFTSIWCRITLHVKKVKS
jgi:hypothetical protein